MLPLLSFHAIAAQRGDGLKPELLALLRRHASTGSNDIPDEPATTAAERIDEDESPGE